MNKKRKRKIYMAKKLEENLLTRLQEVENLNIDSKIIVKIDQNKEKTTLDIFDDSNRNIVLQVANIAHKKSPTKSLFIKNNPYVKKRRKYRKKGKDTQDEGIEISLGKNILREENE